MAFAVDVSHKTFTTGDNGPLSAAVSNALQTIRYAHHRRRAVERTGADNHTISGAKHLHNDDKSQRPPHYLSRS